MSELDYHLIGDDMQAVVINLVKGQVIRAEAGALVYMTDGIDMDAKMVGGIKTSLFGGKGSLGLSSVLGDIIGGD